MNLSNLIQNADIRSVFAVKITALKTQKYWIENLTSSEFFFQTPYPFDQAAYITNVFQNGAALTPAPLTTGGYVALTSGTWYWDRTTLFVETTGGIDPRNEDQTVTVELTYHFATSPKIFNGIYYYPLLKDVPSVSLRVEKDFSGIPQVGNGATILSNESGFFDALTDLNWDGGKTYVYLGADQPQYSKEMDLSDYKSIGTWLNDSWKKTNKEFQIDQKEIKQRLQRTIPQHLYSTVLYPNISVNDIGRPIPIAYGKIYGAAPVCIDITTNRFKLADHAIFSIDEIRVATSVNWVSIPVGTLSLSNGEFTIPTWDGQSNVSVDFHGRKNADGTWMDNATDMITDFLAFCGEKGLDSASFAESHKKMIIGTQNNGTVSVCDRVPSIYLDTAVDSISVIERINKIVGSYLFVDANGNYRYVVFEPKQGEGLTKFEILSLTDFEEDTPSLSEISEISAIFSARMQDGWGQIIILSKTSNQYDKGEPEPVKIDPVIIDISESDDAQYWAARQLIFQGLTPKEYIIKHAWSALLLLPTDQIHVIYTRTNTKGQYRLDKILEVMEISESDAKMQISSSDRHNFRDETGFWMEDADVLPTRFSNLTGYGSRTDGAPDGSIIWYSGWDDQIKTWARQNCGWWAEDNGFVDSTDSKSYHASVYF